MDHARAWLTLAGTRGVGARQVTDLLDRLGSIDKVLESGKSALESPLVPADVATQLLAGDQESIDRSLEWLNQDEDNHLVTWNSPEYPTLLREIPYPPILLFARGDTAQLKRLLFAIVGSRNPTPAGSENAFEFARYLATSGLSIVSGLAAGVDGKSHEGALRAAGNTIAVCGTGLDQTYPRRHDTLASSIAANGLLLSEFFPGTPPLRENFPRRNRIISGLSLGVLVVEAGLRSGSLITARLAAEQGREVFAIPGSIHNPMARGCHLLIRNGAKLVESAFDIIDELGPLAGVASGDGRVGRCTSGRGTQTRRRL